jgi:hypothetical protein
VKTAPGFLHCDSPGCEIKIATVLVFGELPYSRTTPTGWALRGVLYDRDLCPEHALGVPTKRRPSVLLPWTILVVVGWILYEVLR